MSEEIASGMDQPVLLVNSTISGYAAGQSTLADAKHLEATFRYEHNRMDTTSIPQGSVRFAGNISPGTKKQQGVLVSIDSSEFSAVIELMMKANSKRTISAIAVALGNVGRRWPERHWDALDL